MRSLTRLTLAAALAAALPLAANAAPVGLDGAIGSEWNGVTATHVLFDAGAATSNFGAPTNENHNVAYDIYMRTDSKYLYAGLATTGPALNSTLNFANLYFALVYGGGTQYASIGFETTNDKAFYPSTGAAKMDTAANLIQTASVAAAGGNPAVIEVAIDLSVFTENALGVVGFSGLPTGATADGILMTLSQSFGYSVAGGIADYGNTRLGFAALQAVPEPASLALVGLALAGAFGVTRRRQRQR